MGGHHQETPKVRKAKKPRGGATKARKGKQEQVVYNGDGGGREKAEQLDGVGGVFTRVPVATVNSRCSGRLLESTASLLSIDER
eukprot:2189108-Pleurochrysis_carterae.AAC.1